MDTSRFSGREKGIAWIAALVISLALAYITIEPLIKRDRGLNPMIAAEELKWRKSLRDIERLKNADKQYQKYAELMRFKGSEEQGMADILSAIEALAQTSGIRLVDMKPQNVKREDFYKIFSVNLMLEGRLSEIALFMYNLQNPPYLIKVDKLRIEKENTLQPQLKTYLQVSKVSIP